MLVLRYFRFPIFDFRLNRGRKLELAIENRKSKIENANKSASSPRRLRWIEAS